MPPDITAPSAPPANAATVEAAAEKTLPAASPPPAKPSDGSTPRQSAEESAFDELDRIAGDEAPPKKEGKKPSGGKPKEKPGDAKPKDDLEEALDKEGEEKPGEQAKTEEGEDKPKKPAAAPESDAVPQKAPELRAAYLAAKKKLQEQDAQIAELKSKTASGDSPEMKVLVERLAEKDARIKGLEEQLTFASYEQTEEYKERWEKPFVEAYRDGIERASKLTVVDSEGVTRHGTREDFERVLRTLDDNMAADMAVEIYGNKSGLVLALRERIREANKSRAAAIEDHKKNGAEREKAMVEQRAKQKAEMEKARSDRIKRFDEMNAATAEKYPAFFKPTEGDEEGNTLLEKGFKFVDQAFKPDGKVHPEQMVKIHSVIRNKAAAFDRIALELRRARAKIKAVMKEKEDLISGEGAGAGRRQVGASGAPLSPEAELDQIAASNG